MGIGHLKIRPCSMTCTLNLMGKAARAIIIQNNKILLMRHNKQGGDYYTLIGGPIKDGESPEQALVREVKEESGLDVTNARLVFIEEHPVHTSLKFLVEYLH